MLKTIEHTHPIFVSTAYQNDIVAFNLVEVIKTSAKLIVSDEESFIVCSMLFPTVPTWIWTADNITAKQFTALGDYLCNNFPNENGIYFVAKPEVATLLAKRFDNKNITSKYHIGMQSFECPQVIPAKNQSANIQKPTEQDVESLIPLCYNYFFNCFGREQASDELLKEAQDFIGNKKAFVIKENSKIIAMAKSTRETDKHIAVNGVYTLPEYRNRGYAAALVAHIAKLIISEGKTPLLYTDLSNPSSNKAYINVGFIERGRVDEIKLEWGSNNE